MLTQDVRRGWNWTRNRPSRGHYCVRICTLLDRLTHHVHILEMNGESYRLAASKKAQRRSAQGQSQTPKTPNEGGPATKT
jgi:hypothetical protein